MSKKKWRYNWYRRPCVHQQMVENCELREDGERVDWSRGGRRPHDLDPWTNEPRHSKQKSWKKKRKNQYREAGIRTDANKHVIFITEWRDMWQLEEYLEKYNIPFIKKEKRTIYYKKHIQRTKQVIIGYEPWYGYAYQYKEDIKPIQRGWKPIYKEVTLATPIITKYRCGYTESWTFTYWAKNTLTNWKNGV